MVCVKMNQHCDGRDHGYINSAALQRCELHAHSPYLVYNGGAAALEHFKPMRLDCNSVEVSCACGGSFFLFSAE